jgi:hypothetical protein
MPKHLADQDTNSRVGMPTGRTVYLAVVPLLFLLALLPRLVGLGEATTEDEDQWVQRTGNFALALSRGQWRNTYQIGHPGVTTMWVTELALGRDRARAFAVQERGDRHVTQVEDFLPALRTARIPFAILSALLATACGLLAARLFGPGPGLLAGLLLGLEPYWSAMSPIVGMDGLLAGLMGASLLSALLAFRAEATWRWAPVSGLLAGLALLTKGAALFLLPMAPLLALLEVWQAPKRAGARRSAAAKLALWCLGLVTAAAIWPAMWADPLGTARRAAEFIRTTGSTPHAPGNFFLGQPVVDPGPLFYPVALGLRLGPATILGLLALVLFGVPARWRSAVGPLVLYVALLGSGLTISPKKVDRYILPLLPALGVLAALGWWLALRCLVDRFRAPPAVPLGLVLIGLVQVWPLVGAGPHPLAAYNPLFGGIRTAERALPVGWGEGLEAVGDYLKRQPNADRLVTGIWYPLRINFQAHAPGRALNLQFNGPGQVSNQQLFDQADFYVDYIHARQRRLTPRVLAGRSPDFVATIGGVEYARVYRLK